MNKTLLLALSLLLTTTLTAQISELKNPRPSPRQKTEIKLGTVDVSLEYSRPSMKGRKIFGGLVPYDKVWRTGADKNTKITFDDYVEIEGAELAPGNYTIFTKPSSDKWEIYFHTEIDEYGVPDNFNPENSIAQVSVPVLKLNTALETLAVSFGKLTANSATLTIAWEKAQVSMPIKIMTSKIIENYLSKEKISLSDKHNTAAVIYFSKEKNSKKALVAINQAIKILEEGGTFEKWLEKVNLEDKSLASNYCLKSLILESLDKKEQAIESAKKSLIIANKIKSEYYIKRNRENIEKWTEN